MKRALTQSVKGADWHLFTWKVTKIHNQNLKFGFKTFLVIGFLLQIHLLITLDL